MLWEGVVFSSLHFLSHTSLWLGGGIAVWSTLYLTIPRSFFIWQVLPSSWFYRVKTQCGSSPFPLIHVCVIHTSHLLIFYHLILYHLLKLQDFYLFILRISHNIFWSYSPCSKLFLDHPTTSLCTELHILSLKKINRTVLVEGQSVFLQWRDSWYLGISTAPLESFGICSSISVSSWGCVNTCIYYNYLDVIVYACFHA